MMKPIGIVTNQQEGLITATRTCVCCDMPWVEEVVDIVLLEESIPAICPYCVAKAEDVAGAEQLTELLADLEGDLYYETICDINYLLAGGTRLWN